MKLLDANPAPRITGVEELSGRSNYFIGNDPAKWRTNVPTYAKVKYQDVYPGVDLVYYGNQQQLECDIAESELSTEVPQATKQQVLAACAKLPLGSNVMVTSSFEPIQGQTDTHVKFLSRGSGHTLFLTPTEAVVTLTKADAHAKRRISGEAKRAEPEMAQAATFSAREVGGVDEGGTCGIELRREYVLSAPKGTQGLDKTSPQFEARMTLRGGLARSTQRRVHDD